MDNSLDTEFNITFVEVFLALKEKIVVILGITMMTVILGWLSSMFLLTPKYEASVNMIVNTRTDLSGSVTNDNISSARNLVDTYAIIIKSNRVLNQVIDSLHLLKSYETLYQQVQVDAINNTQVMKISVQDKDAELAKLIVDTISQIAPEIIVEAVEAGSCKVISEVAVGNKPVFPNVCQNTVIAGLFGFLITVAVVILKYLLVDHIVDEFDVQKKLELPVLGVIPDVKE